MNIVLLGSGNVATHLAKALKAKGENILQVYSQNLDNAKFLAVEIGAEAICNFADLSVTADLYIISVKDDAINEVAAQLKNVSGLVVHTSGTTGIDVLSKQGLKSGVFYPLQTFSKAKSISFDNIPLCIEAETEADLDTLEKLANTLSNKVYKLDGEKRKVLHLAAVFACNFPNHLYALAAKILNSNQLEFDILRPLIFETADKVMTNLPIDVQTGPAVREDQNTINKHLKMLIDMPELQDIYQTLSNSIKITHK
ncbi:DUF2520 domain-containing protein [Pedobacter aquatilis]|uniref:Rossmann-like and DUF2520 domain-containing protein n=1 Tax=Pedobacter aquatilis TaxID=351343 RepID=UPI0025B58183|nr:Rossmann-like and DUF2520 domain-containing protein [Pedobacter aquatilis]MDN3588409.1 DUF2520 domain-containing protein [Pedobacter aquatilis]